MATPYALLLLPPPPSTSLQSLRDAYEPTLSTVFLKLAEDLNGANCTAVLDIALAIPGLLSPSNRPRGRIFASLQHILASVYTLVGAVCAAKNIDLDAPGGIDTRVIFINYDPNGSGVPEDRHQGPRDGPVLDLSTLAGSARPWDCVYHLDTTSGQKLAAAFLGNLNAQPRTYSVPSGQNWASSGCLLIPDEQQQATPHYSVAVGGTFDHLHIGHKLLLTATALALDPLQDADLGQDRLITVGVTGDELLVKKKYAEFLESWDERCQSTASFLTSIVDFTPSENNASRTQKVSKPGPNGKYILMQIRPGLSLRLVQISDPFGPTITDQGISALVVSKETRSGGQAVNNERAKKSWAPLDVFEVDVLHSGEVAAIANTESFESKISSTDIRRRRMDQAKV